MDKTRLELNCPACGKTRVVHMERRDSLLSALFRDIDADYLFRGAFSCECGKRVLGSMHMTAYKKEAKGGGEEHDD
jgi:hypothetical protein